MWLSRRKTRAGVGFLILGLVLSLAACGFRPMYQKKNGLTSAETSAIEIAPIADRTGQILRNHLVLRLQPRGRAKKSAYVLTVKLSENTKNLALRLDEVATRANLTIRARYTLVHISEAKKLTEGSVQSTVSYNLLREDFATISARESARKRGAKQLADEIWARLAIYLGRRRQNEQKPAPKTPKT